MTAYHDHARQEKPPVSLHSPSSPPPPVHSKLRSVSSRVFRQTSEKKGATGTTKINITGYKKTYSLGDLNCRRESHWAIDRKKQTTVHTERFPGATDWTSTLPSGQNGGSRRTVHVGKWLTSIRALSIHTADFCLTLKMKWMDRKCPYSPAPRAHHLSAVVFKKQPEGLSSFQWFVR